MAEQEQKTAKAQTAEKAKAVNGAAKTDNKVKFMATSALMTAVMCILGPLSIPIGPVPVSLTNLAIYLTLYILDWKRGTVAYLMYLLIGLIGVPVFSGFTGGVAKLAGPTGGYLIGFIPMTILIGLFVDRYFKNRVACVAVMEAATWIAYLLGTAWLAIMAKMTFSAALALGVTPFIIEDLAKMVIAAILGPVLRVRLASFRRLS